MFACITMAFDMGEVPMLAELAFVGPSPPLSLRDCNGLMAPPPKDAEDGRSLRSFPRRACGAR